MLLSHAPLFLLLFIRLAASQTDCSRNYDEPCQSSPGDVRDGDGVWPQLIHKVSKRALISNETRLWPNGIVYYKIDAQFTESEKRIILEAMIDWENQTCIRFREGENSIGYVMISLSSKGCCSYIGRVGCKQGLSLRRSCFSKQVVSHELGHVLGMYHEQSRPDRDKYVRILTDNILPEALFNFQKLPSSVINSLGVPYDHNSIMHYPPTAFAKAGHLYTIVSLAAGIFVGSGQCPSRLDFIQINKLYRCSAINSTSNSSLQLPPLNPIPPLPYPNCGEVFRGAIIFQWGFAHNINCQWILAIPGGVETLLTINVNLENSGAGLCTKDYVRVHKGGRWGNKYCSTSRIEERNRGTLMMIEYHTDHFNTLTTRSYTGISVNAVTSDINECSENTDGCSHTCVNTYGSFYCSCPEWMYLSCDQKKCIDINECAYTNGGCKYSCSNIGGGHACNCSNGIDDCCIDGYMLSPDRSKCVIEDVNECENKSLSQCSQFCINEVNSYHCSCKRGYKLSSDGKNCTDINECVEYIKPDHHCTTCINFDGDFLCLCSEGYTYGPDLHTCTDINECNVRPNNCSHFCHNTQGSYTCSCPTGTSLSPDGKTCRDIDECALNLHNCIDECFNTEGSYVCSCRLGFRVSVERGNCIDINECSSGSHECSHICHNTHGSYTCSCPKGTLLSSNSKNCSDINECTSSNHGCYGSCFNTEGSYKCLCPDGFQLASDEKSCEDVNECRNASRHDCSHLCSNTNGSYTCSCPNGFLLTNNNKTCSDINECLLTQHGCHGSCLNTEGSYKCLCPEGFQLSMANNKSCTDINECIRGTHDCSHSCHNTNGSYTCSCPKGFLLSDNRKTCTDINECASNTHGCYGSCLNTEGSYTCLCPDGLQLSIADNRSCTDINECSTGGHNCSHNCHNTNGSYVCSCPPGSLLFNGRDCSISVQLTAASGSISLNRSDSKWRIIIPDTNKVINLTFQSLSISCSSGGLVEVFNGLNPLSSVPLLRTCGTTVPSPIISSINELSLEYKTGGVNDLASLKYETVTSPTIKTCFAVLGNKERFSLNPFPSKYSTSMSCNYYVIPSRRTVTLRVLYTDLDFENCTSDYLSVHSTFQTSVRVGAVCNAKGETVFRTHSSFMLIIFRGSTLSKYRGFEALVEY